MFILLLLGVCVLFYFFYVIVLFILHYYTIRFHSNSIAKTSCMSHIRVHLACVHASKILNLYTIKLSLLLLTFPIDESGYLECHCNYYSRSNKFSIQSLQFNLIFLIIFKMLFSVIHDGSALSERI